MPKTACAWFQLEGGQPTHDVRATRQSRVVVASLPMQAPLKMKNTGGGTLCKLLLPPAATGLPKAHQLVIDATVPNKSFLAHSF